MKRAAVRFPPQEQQRVAVAKNELVGNRMFPIQNVLGQHPREIDRLRRQPNADRYKLVARDDAERYDARMIRFASLVLSRARASTVPHVYLLLGVALLFAHALLASAQQTPPRHPLTGRQDRDAPQSGSGGAALAASRYTPRASMTA